MDYDLIVRNWEAAFLYDSPNSKEVIVLQAPVCIGMVPEESFCRILARPLFYQCTTAWMRLHESFIVFSPRVLCGRSFGLERVR